MKEYQLVSAENIEVVDLDVSTLNLSEDWVKVRITHVMPSLLSANIFMGVEKREYPFVMGTTAIGIVSDDREEYGLKRGTKVIINPYNDTIHQSKFMRDFSYLPIDKITPFPEGVKEEEAIFTKKIATALAVFDNIKKEKGDYVVIIGGSSICNLVAQIALYYQMIPIMIDTNRSFLDRANNCGVYYTVDATKDVPTDFVKEITGGKMADSVVFEVNYDASSAYVFQLLANNGKCVILNEHGINKNLEANITEIGLRQIEVVGVSSFSAVTNFDSAIYMLAQNELKLDNFIDKSVNVSQTGELLRELFSAPDAYYCPIIEI